MPIVFPDLLRPYYVSDNRQDPRASWQQLVAGTLGQKIKVVEFISDLSRLIKHLMFLRSYSESSCPSSTNPTEKLNATAWLGGWQIPNRNSSSNTQQTPNNTPNFTSGFLFPDRNRVRRSSSKDIEEAMASGLGKVSAGFAIISICYKFRFARLICICLQYKAVSASEHKLVITTYVAKRTRTSNASVNIFYI